VELTVPGWAPESKARAARGFRMRGARYTALIAGVAQLVERQLPKLNVAGSSPVSRCSDRKHKWVAGVASQHVATHLRASPLQRETHPRRAAPRLQHHSLRSCARAYGLRTRQSSSPVSRCSDRKHKGVASQHVATHLRASPLQRETHPRRAAPRLQHHSLRSCARASRYPVGVSSPVSRCSDRKHKGVASQHVATHLRSSLLQRETHPRRAAPRLQHHSLRSCARASRYPVGVSSPVSRCSDRKHKGVASQHVATHLRSSLLQRETHPRRAAPRLQHHSLRSCARAVVVH
jgi:hypothetical protein